MDQNNKRSNHAARFLSIRFEIPFENKEKIPTSIIHSVLMIQHNINNNKYGEQEGSGSVFEEAGMHYCHPLLITVCIGGQLSESESFFNFIKAVDPQNVLGIVWNGLVAHPCLHKLRGVKCNSQSIVEIRLENLNLRCILDVDDLCKLPNLKVLSLAKNHIRGNIPNSILHCTRMTYLNLSNSHLSGRLPLALTKLKYLRRLDISKNHFTSIKPQFVQEFRSRYTYYSKSSTLQRNSTGDWVKAVHSRILSEGPSPYDDHDSELNGQWIALFGVLPLVLGIGLFLLYIYIVGQKAAKEREIL